MTLTSVPLAKLKVWADWKASPVGTLLQARATNDNDALVGLRCEMNINNLAHPCLLVLDGERRGALLEDRAIRDAVVDVSSLLEVRVAELSPMTFSREHFELFGAVCTLAEAPQHFLGPCPNGGWPPCFCLAIKSMGSGPYWVGYHQLRTGFNTSWSDRGL